MQRKMIAGLGGMVLLAGASSAQTGSASGEQQAAAGAQTYAGRCAACHGAKLTGGGGPALAGEAYWSHWNGRPARALYDEIVSTMPMDDPGSLKPAEAIALVVFFQKANGGDVPATAIADPAALDAIRIAKPSAGRAK